MLLVEYKKIKVIHQVLNPKGSGGVSSEYRALEKSSLNKKYEFIPMILKNFKAGLNFHDILFYYNFIKKTDVDIIHIRGAAVDGLNAVIAAKIAGKGKILVTVHGMYSDLVYISPLKKWISKNIIEKLIFNLADGISCVCKNANNRKYFDKYRKKMLPFVYNRMPYYDKSKFNCYKEEIRKKYKISMNSIICLYLGRITKEKGLDYFLEAIKKIFSEGNKKLYFIFVGDGNYKKEIEKKCQLINNRIIFVGDQREVVKFYASADFFVQPSLHENHSISLLEAIASELPCIATNCGGNLEIIENNKTGIIVPIKDSEGLYKAIKSMLNVRTRNSFKEAIMKEKYEKFSDKSIDSSLENVYKRIMEK